jgi:ABC-type lipoprotein export system ATPase subunit
MTLNLLELSDYTLAPAGSGKGISDFHFTLNPGDVYLVDSSHPDDAGLFMRALATLVRPVKGLYTFMGRRHDLRRYEDMLCCKQKIGYVAPDAALISNLTIRQNLMLQRFYHEEQLNIDLAGNVLEMCVDFGIADKLDLRPAGLHPMEVQAAIIIREITKQPAFLLLNQPEDYVGHARYDLMVQMFNQLMGDRVPMVLLSHDQHLVEHYVNHKVLITDGSLASVSIKASLDQ